MNKQEQQRREVHYSGHVQGVGFRYRTSQIANRYPVEGYVQNVANGQVYLVVEAQVSVLNEFLTEIDDVLAGNIRDRVVDKRRATGEFNSFQIRRETRP